MATKKTTTTNPIQQLADLKQKYSEVRLDIRSGKNSNTNAHKQLKKEIAQLLTQINTK